MKPTIMRLGHLFFIFLLFSCTQNKVQSDNNIVKFEDLVELENVSSVSVWNNIGDHEVKGNNRKELLGLIGSMTLDKNGSYKLGGKSIELTIDGEKFTLLGRTNGNYIEVDRKIVTKNKESIEGIEVLYFKVSNLNIDNY
jgi:hypothetical protein